MYNLKRETITLSLSIHFQLENYRDKSKPSQEDALWREATETEINCHSFQSCPWSGVLHTHILQHTTRTSHACRLFSIY